MSGSRLIGVFESEGDVLSAVRELRREGLVIADVFSPYAVHGLDRAAGMPRSRLGWVCAVLGLLAAAGMLGFQQWVSAVDWPINVGGKPYDSIPAFVPVMFEVGVLAAGLGTVLAFLIVSRLYPGKRPRLAHPAVTDNCFVVVVEAPEGEEGLERAAQLCRENYVVELDEEAAGDKGDAAGGGR